jgi:hypothetical protein
MPRVKCSAFIGWGDANQLGIMKKKYTATLEKFLFKNIQLVFLQAII